ncbi:hypothetical protein RDABS01_037997 [Bienertia sinuspersici]
MEGSALSARRFSVSIFRTRNRPVPAAATMEGSALSARRSSDSTISDLKSLLQSSTNVLPRGQKLIHKVLFFMSRFIIRSQFELLIMVLSLLLFVGGILIDSKTLRSSGISNGAKIMLMASQGLHQGEGPKIKDAPVVSNHRKIMNADRISKPTQEVPVEKKRTERWKIMGDIGLSDHHLKA